jgi:small subunit ribosomal protein S8
MNEKTVQLLVALKNASLTNKESLSTDSNEFTARVLTKLYDEGFILSYRTKRNPKFKHNLTQVKVDIRYIHSKPIFKDLHIVSKPSFESFLNYNNIARIMTRKKVFIFTTQCGLLSLKECQREQIGGILLFSV